MSAVILADSDPLYAWFVTETLQRVGVPVTWFRSAGPAVALAAAGDGDRLLLVDANTWLANPAPGPPPGFPARAPAVILGWESERKPPDGYRVTREKPGDTDVLCRLVAEASASGPAGAAAVERSPGGAG
jgi:hypothetical protein